MKKKLRTNLLLEGVMLFLSMMLASCGNGDNALEEIINGGGSGGSSTVTEITIDPLTTPLTLEVLSEGDNTIVIHNPRPNMKYKKNDEALVIMDGTDVTITVTKGDKVAFYGNGTSITSYEGTVISGGTAQVKVYGNIMSLLDETGFATLSDPITLQSDNTFQALFRMNTTLIDASGLLLPATTLTYNCYGQMFEGCTSLTTAPKLPATTLANYCYRYMFAGCTNLAAAPELLVTELKVGCYIYMFGDCTTLTTTPKLPATTLADYCYYSMFEGCTSLTKAYVKAAPADIKCLRMFTNCTKTGGTFYSVDVATANTWITKFNTYDPPSLQGWTGAAFPTE